MPVGDELTDTGKAWMHDLYKRLNVVRIQKQMYWMTCALAFEAFYPVLRDVALLLGFFLWK